MNTGPASSAADWPRRLAELRDRPALVLGLLSGTSADGIDAAICRITPADDADGLRSRVELLHHFRHLHDPQILGCIADPAGLGARRLAELNKNLGRRFAEACLAAINASECQPHEI